jgi:hypothetical protein
VTVDGRPIDIEPQPRRLLHLIRHRPGWCPSRS